MTQTDSSSGSYTHAPYSMVLSRSPVEHQLTREVCIVTGGAQATWIASGMAGHTPRAGGEIKEMMAPYTSWSG